METPSLKSEPAMILLDKQKILPPGVGEDTVPGVQAMLQGAVKLELATLPPYLTGVFSVKAGANAASRTLTQSVATEEMLHLALAANTLIAVGGNPQVSAAGLSLSYPGQLPMAIDTSLEVQLAALTKPQVHDVFMGIERPDTEAVLPGESAPPEALALRKANPSFMSIGDFYNFIIAMLRVLVAAGTDPFAEPRLGRQVDLAPWFAGVIPGNPTGKVHDLKTAVYNLKTIIRQGEGAQVGSDPINPTGDAEGGLAHYFKFGEIYYGKELVRDKNDPSGWSYSGADVPLDPQGVYDFPSNARLSDYPAGSAAAISAEQFYEAYLRLLRGLDRAFNGDPGFLSDAIGTMYELKLVAQQVVLHPADPNKPNGKVAAPPFQP